MEVVCYPSATPLLPSCHLQGSSPMSSLHSCLGKPEYARFATLCAPLRTLLKCMYDGCLLLPCYPSATFLRVEKITQAPSEIGLGLQLGGASGGVRAFFGNNVAEVLAKG